MNVQDLLDNLYAKPNATKIQNELAEIEELYRDKGALAASVTTEFNTISERMIMVIVHKGEEYKDKHPCIGVENYYFAKRKLLLKIGKKLP